MPQRQHHQAQSISDSPFDTIQTHSRDIAKLTSALFTLLEVRLDPDPLETILHRHRRVDCFGMLHPRLLSHSLSHQNADPDNQPDT
jgi:hypothetical protein